ncbi:glutamyl-tRNA reductase [Acidihalobacter ferrooxydans]|uniref:Glutamyl-tRNA reductase n=1 Tax=Acidihalobacter ferrooxydans TaxID=1765967 RepID=A0A1P8UGM4_9GAMM|nr:glutamyl-tRNA reductase [Acidihalobacter ferrooxydans]APZ42914.1 glutamyl-tRNA reductase [Acidihalobacter ferrooxydans]
MPLVTIGINHKTAPLDVREKVVFAPEQMNNALHELIELPGLREAAILSTCNRTELYCNLQETAPHGPVIDWLGQYHRFDSQSLRPYLYDFSDADAVKHTIRVASGLDSMVLGEPQILGQLKTAYGVAAEHGTLGKYLRRLFQHAFAVAKHVRTDTAIGSSAVSVAFAAVSLARQIFADLSQQRALLIGAGETIELAARHLRGNGLTEAIVANRTPERAARLANEIGAMAISLTDIPQVLHQADIIISSTASPLPILGKGAVERAIRQRRHQPMFMVDLAVPRDIEPEVGTLDDVYLYTVDDLERVVAENIASRYEAATQAEEIVAAQTEHFMGWLRAQDVVSLIRSYRDRAERTRDDVLHKAQRQLAQGRPPEEVLTFLAETLTNKLTHEPTAALDHAARDGRLELIAAAHELLHLPRDTNKP